MRLAPLALGVTLGVVVLPGAAAGQTINATRLAILQAEDRRAASAADLATLRMGARSLDPQTVRLAIRALGGAKAPAARDALLHLTEGGRTLLGREKLPPKSPVLLAALRALATGGTNTPAVRRVLARAAASPDPDIRNATTSLPEQP